MKQHTTSFKENIKLLGKQQNIQIIYGENIIESESVNSINFYYEGNLLKSVMKGLNIDSNINIPLNTEIQFKYGLLVNGEYEYLDFGKYIVYESKKQEDTNSFSITCYDKLLYSMKDYEAMDIIYPITVENYLKAICNHLGIEYNEKEIANANRMIYNELYLSYNEDKKKWESLNYTFRDVLDEISQVTAGTICINEEDKLEVRYINDTGDAIDEEYLKDINVNFGEKYGKINSIVLSRAGQSDNIYLRDEQSVLDNGLCEVKIVDNQIMNFNDREDYLPAILEKLNGIEYYINDFSSTGIIYYDLLDRYNVKIGNNTYSCIMLNNEINITQGLEELIYTEKPKESQTDYKKADKTDRRINQTYIIVDKQNQQIESLVNEIGDRTDKKTTITQDIERIEQKVENTVDITRDSTGIQELILEECMEGHLLELHIYGNNTVFMTLYPRPTLYPSSILYPKSGKAIIQVTNYDENDKEIITEYSLGNFGVLRQKGNVYDEYALVNNKASIIRRIGVLENGSLYELAQPIIEELGEYKIDIRKGTNIVHLKGYEANMYARYVTINDYTETFATTVQLESSIKLLEESIDIKVSKKVDDTEIISAINLSPEEIKILANKIGLEGYVTINQTFKVDENGSIECIGGEIGGFDIDRNAIYSSAVGVVSSPSMFSGIAFWAGASTGNIGSAPYKVLENGTVYGLGGFICQDANRYSNLSLSGYTTNGTVTASDIVNNSQAELKENIEIYDGNATELINNTDIYTYNYIGKTEPKIGVVIGEGYNTAEEIIVTRINPATKDITKGIDIYTMCSISWQAHKEKDAKIQELQQEISDLKEKLNKLIERLG